MKRSAKLILTILSSLIAFVACTFIGYVPLLCLSEIYGYSYGIVVTGGLLLGLLGATFVFRILWKKLLEHRPNLKTAARKITT